MDMKTGAIAQFENDDDARKAGHKLKLSPVQAVALTPIPRPERLAWAAAEVAKRRQANKAARRARRANRK
jgi:hypothetical protein